KIASPRGAKVLFLQSRLDWDKTKNQIHADLGKLETKIRGEMPDEADLAAALKDSLAAFDDRLSDALDSAFKSKNEQDLEKDKAAARGVLKEYLQEIASNAMIKHLDQNPFVPLSVQSSLTKVLSSLAVKLGK